MISNDAAIHRMQRAFRTAMDAFAHPGKVVRLADVPADSLGLCPPLAVLTRMFVDQAVTFFCDDEGASSRIAAETKAKSAPLGEALFVAVPACSSRAQAVVEGACAGTPASPEKGATVFFECGRISSVEEAGLIGFDVEGPGVRDTQRFWADSDAWQRARIRRGDEYPLGIEIMLVDADGYLAVLPRSCRVTRAEGGR
ncbi:MAG: phosphonate C-P lyase system protein PhnH [Slackia sp.]|nr:phosphonate C-P lyase system protein PhnH [Slackia sp.]